MADKLQVDGDELDRFMRLLNRSNSSLKALRRALADATVTGLGTDDLDKACEEFQDDWKFGAEQIGKQTEDLAKIIGKSKQSYQEVDKALEAALNKAEANGKHKGAGASGGGT
ncbi:type VII secretion target [Streptomyces silaceus]|uniref:type VII secretion target n=1 Tax=Streptomyces silaceus TaxID=545123 RepID=UPI0006EB531B|nr:type VII secretion target [Streptomyces silaceus]